MFDRLRQYRFRWRSKTLWFNLFCAVLAGIEMNLHFLRGILDDAVYGVGAFVVAMVNIVLRITTTQPLIERVDETKDDDDKPDQPGRG
jgi:hypothetical protein